MVMGIVQKQKKVWKGGLDPDGVEQGILYGRPVTFIDDILIY
jgi:hypothetical protein